MHIPEDGLVCPVCGCTTLDVAGAFDLVAGEVADDATLTCESCHESGAPDLFAHHPHSIEAAYALCARHEVPIDCATSTVDDIVESYLDARADDLFDTLRDIGGCDKMIASAVVDAWERCVRHEAGRATLTTDPIPTPSEGNVRVCATRCDHESPTGIDVYLDGADVNAAPVVTVAKDPDDPTTLVIDVWSSDAQDVPETLRFDLTSLTRR